MENTKRVTNPKHIAYPLIDEARSLLKVKVSPGTDYGKKVCKKIYARLREGFTPGELRNALHVAYAESQKSPKPFFKNLTWIWGNGCASLAASDAGAVRKKGPLPTFVEGPELDQWEGQLNEVEQRDIAKTKQFERRS